MPPRFPSPNKTPAWWLLLLWFGLSSLHAAPPIPVAGAGAQSRTLLVHAQERGPYTLVSAVDTMQLHLGRIQTDVQTVSMDELAAERLNQANYLVVLCPDTDPTLPPVLLQHLRSTVRPVLWVGYGLPQLQSLRPFYEKFHVHGGPVAPPQTILTRDNLRFALEHFTHAPVRIPTNNTSARIHWQIEQDPATPESTPALAWSQGRIHFFAAIPESFSSQIVFHDRLLDFFQVRSLNPSRILICIQDYHPASNHAALQRMVDYLYDRGLPFVLAATLDTQSTPQGAPAFWQSLLYAQRRGGRLVLRGLQPNGSSLAHFWNPASDLPPEPAPQETLALGLGQIVPIMIEEALYPLGWQTPGSAESRAWQSWIGKTFSLTLGPQQISDLTHLDRFEGVALYRDLAGRQRLPLNLGPLTWIHPQTRSRWQSRARQLLSLPGNIAGGFLTPYQAFEEFQSVVAWLIAQEKPFLDLTDLDLFTSWPRGLLLTGRAEKTLERSPASVEWTAHDDSGQIGDAFLQPGAATAGTWRKRSSAPLEMYRFEFNPADP